MSDRSKGTAESRSKVADYAIYLLARLAVMLVRSFPLWFDYFGARVVGWFLYRLVRVHRERGLGHLRLSFPGWPEEKIRRVLRASATNLAVMAMEMVLSPRKIRAETWPRHFRMKNMAETVRLLLDRDRGLILLMGHFGNWEAAGYMTAAIGLPTVTVARRIKNRYMNRWILALRERAGQHMVPKTGAAAEIAKAMESKEAISMVFDQNAGRQGVFVDYFGRKASTYKSIGLIAMFYGAPIVVATCRRLDYDYHFEVEASRIIYPREWADEDDPLYWITQEYTRALEGAVRTDPGQYFWVHRRWKHRPPGEQRSPDGVS